MNSSEKKKAKERTVVRAAHEVVMPVGSGAWRRDRAGSMSGGWNDGLWTAPDFGSASLAPVPSRVAPLLATEAWSPVAASPRRPVFVSLPLAAVAGNGRPKASLLSR